MQPKVTYHASFFCDRDRAGWNALVRVSRNATFLFDRGFMEYHADRFADASIVIRKDGNMVAGLPAHREDGRARSHGGLTYGGFFYTDRMRIGEVFGAFSAALELLHHHGFPVLDIKPIPSIYHEMPSDEVLCALFAANARLTHREPLWVAIPGKAIIAKTRREAIGRGSRNGLQVREETSFSGFWNEILIPNLDRRYEAKPVHSLEEIEMLHARFPHNIRQFNVYQNGVLIAGTTVFESDRVAHPQYLSSHEERNQSGAVDFLYHYLLSVIYREKPYFDFGTSASGKGLNQNLVSWKESFGARAVVQDRYEVPTENHKLLHDLWK